MASAALHGRFGSIRLSTSSTATTAQTAIAELRNYTLTVEGDYIDVTSHDSSGWREGLNGTRRWSWTADVVYLSTGAGQAIYRPEFTTSNPGLVNVTFKQSTSNTAKLWKGKTRLTGFTANHDTNDAVLGTLTGEGSGALTRSA